MPSPHRRVGLVLDEAVEAALLSLIANAAATGEAPLVRRAVLEGTAFEALLRAVRDDGPGCGPALAALRAMRLALAEIDELPPAVRSLVLEQIDRVDRTTERDLRRRRQLALLDSPGPSGASALDWRRVLDAPDPLAG
jgi:hypothetical protein